MFPALASALGAFAVWASHRADRSVDGVGPAGYGLGVAALPLLAYWQAAGVAALEDHIDAWVRE